MFKLSVLNLESLIILEFDSFFEIFWSVGLFFCFLIVGLDWILDFLCDLD